MQMSKAIQGYVYSSLAEGFSPLTLNVYRSALCKLIEYIGDKQVQDITTDDLKRFMDFLVTEYIPTRKNAPLSTASHHRYWKAIRSFFKWAEKDLNIGRPDLPLKMPLWESKEVVPFTEEEIRLLLKACEFADVPEGKRKSYKFKRPTALRDKALILTLLDTGVRLGELTRLRISDVNLETGEVSIRSFYVKRTTPHTTYLGLSSRKAARKYLFERNNVLHNELFFTTQDGDPLTPKSIVSLLFRLGKSAGIKGVHPYRFRHTFAIQYLRNGGDMYTLQRLLGHKRLEMVNHYLNIVKADAKNAHQRASPVDRMEL